MNLRTIANDRNDLAFDERRARVFDHHEIAGTHAAVNDARSNANGTSWVVFAHDKASAAKNQAAWVGWGRIVKVMDESLVAPCIAVVDLASPLLGKVGFRQDINLAFVVLAASCAGHRPPPPAVSPPESPPAAAATPERVAQESSAFETGFATYLCAAICRAGRPPMETAMTRSLFTAAHRTLPFGTMVEVRRSDGRRVVVRSQRPGAIRRC